MQPRASTHSKLKKCFSRKKCNSRKSPLHCLDAASVNENLEPADPFVQRRDMLIGSLFDLIIFTGYGATLNFFLEPNTEWYKNPLIFFTAGFVANLGFRLTQKNQCIGPFGRSLVFAVMDLSCRQLLIHEGSHAFAANLLFNFNPHPKIIAETTYMGLVKGGVTYSNFSSLTPLGNRTGSWTTNRGIVAASGILGNTISDLITLPIAQAIPDHYPEIKTYLRCSALAVLISNIVYAILAYVEDCTSSNDFCSMQRALNLPPALVAFILLATYSLMQLSLSCISKHFCAKSQPEINTTPHIQEVATTDIEGSASITDTETTRLIRSSKNSF